MKIKIALILLVSCGTVAIFLTLPESPQDPKVSDTLQENAFTKRLQTAAENEESIVQSLINNMPVLIGLLTEDLAPSHQDLLASLANQQGEIRNEVATIEADLIKQRSSNQHEVYEEVMLAIQKSNFDAEFIRIQELILKNQPYTAMESAKAWADRLNHWAEQLNDARIGK